VDPSVVTLAAVALVLVGAVLPGVGIDLVAVLALGLLVIGGVLTPVEAAQGFGNPALLTVAAMFVVAEALQRTGAIEAVSRFAERNADRGPRHLLLVLLPLVMLLSAVMNNTAIVVVFLPIFLASSRTLGVAPSRLLIPLSYAAIFGGTLTLVGTTTNLLVDGIVRQSGMPGLDLLDFLPMGAIASLLGFAYLVLLGPSWLPDRMGLATLVPRALRSDYLTEVLLGPTSPLVGRRLRDLPELTGRVRFLQIVRGEETVWPPFQDLVLQVDDLLLVKGAPEDIVKLLQQRGLTGPPDPGGAGRVADVRLDLAEVMIAPGSGLNGSTVAAAGFRQRHGVVVLGVLRRGEHLREHLGQITLRVGDILLVQGETENVERLGADDDDLILLGGAPPSAPRRHRAWHAILVTALALGLAATGVVSLMVGALLACVVLVSTGCLASGHAYRAVDIRILLVLGCMLGVGLAVERSGIAHSVAGALVDLGRGHGGHLGVLAAIYLSTMLLTEIVTNAGTAGVMVPIAIEAARLDGVSPMPFVMAVAYAASMSLLTPVGYQTNLLVYGPGGYRFTDYLRFGLPLSLLLALASTLLLPLFFPF
jgi:di/tricarboxylate transporter